MRNISFALTTPQFIDGSKDLTRRFGWWFLKDGDRLRAVEKAMGLKKGEKIKSLGVIEVVSTRAEPLNCITPDDCAREGFPDWTPRQFIDFLCEHYGIEETKICNRIEFKKLNISSSDKAWVVGHDGDFDWQYVTGETEEEAKQEWIKEHGNGEDYCSPKCLSATRMEICDGKSPSTSMWFNAGLGCNCDKCGCETWRETGGIVNRKGEIVCDDCRRWKK